MKQRKTECILRQTTIRSVEDITDTKLKLDLYKKKSYSNPDKTG